MGTKRRLAVSYSRFSAGKQADGDSQRRQDAAFKLFCTLHDLTPSGEAYRDEGRSGYHDEHRRKGRLGELVQAAKDGAFEPETVVVVEAWDRLGRLRPDKQTSLIADLLRTGVGIGICRLNDIFVEDDFGTHKWTVLATFVQLAYQESKQKSERVGASWEARRERARAEGALMSKMAPRWLRLVGGKFKVRPEAVPAIKRIFALAAQGLGQAQIIAALTAEGVPSFGDSGTWTRSYVASLLRDARLTGRFQPRANDGTALGDVIEDYYPRVVSDDEWALVRAGQQGRRRKDKRGRALVRNERKHVNLFRSLFVEALSGATFYRAERYDKGRAQVTLRTPAGSGHITTFDYPTFEAAVLQLLSEIDPADVLPRAGREASRAEVLRARLANVREDMAGLQEELKAGFSKALAAVLKAKEAEEQEVARELQAERAKAARPLDRAWGSVPTLAKLVAKEGDAARLRLRPLLGRLVEDGRVLVVRRGSRQLCAVQFTFAGGARRSYLIIRQSGGYHRPGGWQAASLLDATPDAADLDLRRPEDAPRLAALLATVDVAALAELMR
jgi:DNA invertase Pin-like site-specific DNA recombinase